LFPVLFLDPVRYCRVLVTGYWVLVADAKVARPLRCRLGTRTYQSYV